MQRKSIDLNGITLSYLDHGEGPALLLCHGFPETSYAWRHQIPALAAAGYRVLAPDLRGYGESTAPQAIDEYTVFDAVGDLIGLLDALSIERSIVAGGDWGATIAWQAALMRPDRVVGIVALGVPMMGRAPIPPTRLFPRMDGELHYTLYFQDPGAAERELERDVRLSLRRILHAASGDAGLRHPGDGTPNPFGMVAPSAGLLHALPDAPALPAWLSESDLDHYAASFTRSGFRGGLNYYRNLDRNWRLQASLAGTKVHVPALFAVGSRDTGLAMPGMREIIADMPRLVTNLRGSVKIEGAGHWLQQERPDAINDLMLSFADSLSGGEMSHQRRKVGAC